MKLKNAKLVSELPLDSKQAEDSALLQAELEKALNKRKDKFGATTGGLVITNFDDVNAQ